MHSTIDKENLQTEINNILENASEDVLQKTLDFLRVTKENRVLIPKFWETFNASPDMIFIMGEECEIFRVNENACAKLHHSVSELQGTKINAYLSEESREALSSFKNQITATVKSVESLDFKFVSKDGALINAATSIIRFPFDESKYLLFAKDITDLKRTEERLLAKNRELDTFVYKSSHDLKGPLVSIIGLTDIADLEVSDKSALNYFSMIRDCAQRLDKILNDLAELARLRNTATSIQEVPVCELLDETITSFFVDGILKNKFKVIKNYERIYGFQSNEKILRSIFYNVIGNAIKYRKMSYNNECFILIEVKKLSGERISVQIKDNGIGVNKEKLPFIFDMFQRASMSSSGSGLGLYIVKSGLEKIGGSIEVESEENTGSTFTIILPSLIGETSIKI